TRRTFLMFQNVQSAQQLRLQRRALQRLLSRSARPELVLCERQPSQRALQVTGLSQSTAFAEQQGGRQLGVRRILASYSEKAGGLGHRPTRLRFAGSAQRVLKSGNPIAS